MGLSLIAVLAGLFIWTGFAPAEFPLGPYIGILLLYKALVGKEFKKRFFVSAITGLTFFLLLLHWSSSYVGWIPWVSLAVLQASIFATLSLLPWQQGIRSALLFAGFFTVIEILRMKWPFGGFGWGRIGHTQTEFLSGIYSLIGVAGVSFLVVLTSATLTLMNKKLFALFPIVFGISVFAPSSESSESLEIVAVQGGVDQLGLDYNQRALSVLKRHAQTSLDIKTNPDLIIWPENASDIDPFNNRDAKKLIADTIQSTKSPLLVGAVLRESLGPKNVSVLYQANGKVKSMYVKQDLAPFGEYIPIRSIAELISREAKRVTDFQSGTEWIDHEISGKSFNTIICFEVLDDDFLRSGLDEANFLVAQTNNATFGESPQAAQQLQIIRARAAEFQRDFAVVSTTGFTAHVNGSGKVVESLEQFKPGVLEMQVATRDQETLASKLNSWVWLGVLLVALAFNRRSVFTR